MAASYLLQPKRLYIRTATGRTFPLVFDDFISTLNRETCRLVLLHQVALQRVFSEFSKDHGKLEFYNFLGVCEAFEVTPTLCTVDDV